ncbi:MAG: hypothetical protein IJ129_04070, partial [Ruminococcus sp.]|nr:hypothetical protein [Ruminococcus sp.]
MRRVRKPMDPKKAMILATIAVLGMAAAFIVVAVTHLIRPATDFSQAFDGGLSKGERYKGKVYAASSEFYYIEHTINHVIPTGTEHFYLVFDKSYRDIVIVRAPKDFMENFDSGGTNKEGCEIEGFVRESEHDMAERAFDVMVNINGSYESESLRSSFITVYYIDLMGTRIYTLMLIDGVLTAAC